ncbi:hypothetical protein ICI42_06475 [Tianweitania sp. Rool2]|uniref:Uncharacterized protein n=1 Tax=Oryzicola mucosus TaxID=2767425 RepID=A0A8J6U4G8_9HYPH|nr:hypothetical protein [Oryzicola mucosus]
MTRHGMVEPSAAGARPPASDPRAPRVITDADTRPPGSVLGSQYCAKEQRSGLFASIPTLPGGGRAIADIGRSSKSP